MATRQHGVVSLLQLRGLGYTESAIYTRTKAGRLHRLHRGVYAVGHLRLSVRGRWLAAALACGPQALLSHRSAAALHDLRPMPSGPIDVSAPRRHNLEGIRCHTAAALDPRDSARVDAIPVTTIERTLLDLAEVVSPRRLRAALEAAQRRDALDLRRLEELLARCPGRHGLAPLRSALSELSDEAPWLQSELERSLLELVREAGLPEPRANVFVAGELVDFHWAAQKVVVEVDGFRFHSDRRTFENDRRRDTKLQIAGQRVVRVTHARIAGEPATLAAELRELLGD